MSTPRFTTAIFDVEGTLVDCVPQTLACWQRILERNGHAFTPSELQPYSGLDGDEMLGILVPNVPRAERKRIRKEQGDCYKREYIGSTKAFAGIREVFETLKRAGTSIGLATTCSREELQIYDGSMRILELTDAVACGDDALRGKPHPDLLIKALDRLKASRRDEVIDVGDTPYDARAAAAAKVVAIGVSTGGFEKSHLTGAGCKVVVDSIAALPLALGVMQPR